MKTGNDNIGLAISSAALFIIETTPSIRKLLNSATAHYTMNNDSNHLYVWENVDFDSYDSPESIYVLMTQLNVQCRGRDVYFVWTNDESKLLIRMGSWINNPFWLCIENDTMRGVPYKMVYTNPIKEKRDLVYKNIMSAIREHCILKAFETELCIQLNIVGNQDRLDLRSTLCEMLMEKDDGPIVGFINQYIK